MTRYIEPDPIFEWVDYYLGLDWPIFPVHSTEFGHCSCWRQRQCKSPGKHPRNQNGCKGATTDRRVLRSWLHRWPEANVGIATGGSAHLVVIDVDPRHDGDITLTHLEYRYGGLPRTFTVRTGGGGCHLYFSMEGIEPPIRNSAGLLGSGLDVRGEGGYVVAPPSETPSGLYWVETNAKLATIPVWVIDLLQSAEGREKVAKRGLERSLLKSRPGTAADPPGCLDEAVLMMLRAPEGCRNQTLNGIAFWAGRRIAQGSLVEMEVVVRLTAAAELTGLDDYEIQRTIDSALAAGMRRAEL